MCPPAWICRNRPPIPLRTPTQLIGALHTTRHNKVLAPKVSEGTVSLASNHCANWQHGICTYVDVRVDRTQVRFYPKAVHAFCATESCTATSRRVCCPCNIGNGRISPREESSGKLPISFGRIPVCYQRRTSVPIAASHSFASVNATAKNAESDANRTVIPDRAGNGNLSDRS
jgi:hypothetical protein